MIKAIVFDLGGTLIDYAGGYDLWPDMEGPGLVAAYEVLWQKPLRLPAMETFRRIGYNMLPLRWRQATLGERNLTVDDLLQEIVTYLRIGGVKPEWLGEAVAAYETVTCGRTTPLPHAQTVLADLKAQGYKLGLISNTMFRGRAHIGDLEKFGLLGYFDAMLFSGDVNLWKPRAETFHHLLNELDVTAGEAVLWAMIPPVTFWGDTMPVWSRCIYKPASVFPKLKESNPTPGSRNCRSW